MKNAAADSHQGAATPQSAGRAFPAGNGFPTGPWYLGLGTNSSSDGMALLNEAVSLISTRIGPIMCSRVWSSAPRYDLDQPDFLNMAVACFSDADPREMLAACQCIENSLGRVRDPLRPKGPRSIDIDLLMKDGISCNFPDLIIPHPLIEERKFVILPLNELLSTIKPGSELPLPPEGQGIYYPTLIRYSSPSHARPPGSPRTD